jgi:hypothetical protein
MKKCLILIVPLLMIIFLTGCLQVETTITVNRDGSGTVERIFLMQKEILGMLASMSSMGEEDGGEDFELLDRDELNGEAATMGAGVKLVSAEPYETDTFSGYKAVFSFPDINDLRVNQNPGESVPDGAAAEGDSPQEYVTFSLSKGASSTLKIKLPSEMQGDQEGSGTESDMGATAEPAAEDLEMMKQIYGTMKMSMHVQVNGTIRKTNATYREGSTITLMEMDFGKVVENEEKLKLLATNSDESIEGMKALMDDIPGIKVELQDSVEVVFR